MIFICRRERFNAAHRVFVEGWSNEKNHQHFGACSNPNWHGHNYELFVKVKGEPDSVSGYVIDLKLLSKIIKDKVIDKVDHKNLNLEVDFMQGVQPSTENIAKAIFNEISPLILEQKAVLHSIRLHETENNYVEYFGD
ncbi:MAG: 6-carboxytetrahydropterin synthase [Bacteroidetes bacterium]|jgi:6-pyruvoyltetrahydropterin/6-carboxytetrahydropterin synthase|nr:6-carboxytetrahydropterin synthase [Bacteroidota bacterium]MBT5527703.1 6-carboxytetrahydropterin synthase [Cytophagia bacterium]MBT3933163.1 6-carboxytetrahydropterin synthase [Bacteroidota bacterium]MBT4339873.1 6-carboxytetrahydropterin synthase [Bacteroidota bacterium]MBT4968901.1 6-carboxytetrahydropterin synthase [Bacteroidota bacterium]